MQCGVAEVKTRRLIPTLALSFLIGFLFGGFAKYAYESNTFKPYGWNSDPVVVNCYGEDFRELQLVRAVEYWALLGYNISFYEMSPTDFVCKQENLEGFIVLRKAPNNKLDTSTLATTTRATRALTIVSAEILFQPGAHNLTNIIEHELGHAFGFGHVDIEGHFQKLH